MRKQILTVEKDLKKGRIVERLNRFILRVEFDSGFEKIYLANPGALSTVIAPGREVLCEPANGQNRKTKYNAFAIETDDIYVTVKSTFANRIFSRILKKKLLKRFRKYSSISREPPFPTEGRADFLLENENDGSRGYAEIKSCTHVEKGIAKFPDRPTKRGRRHLKTLTKLRKESFDNHLVFVVQRSDAKKFQPFREVDPKFADLLSQAKENKVKIYAFTTRFEPPDLYLDKEDLPIDLI